MRQFLRVLCMLFSSSLLAGIPLWSITPSGGSQPTQQVSRSGSVSVAYLVQNNSRSRTVTLGMLPQQGTSVSPAQCSLKPQGQSNNSCVMTLTIQGSEIPDSGLRGGPRLCALSANGTPNPLQCYQPSLANSLNITITDVVPATTISASVSDVVLATDGIFTAESGAPQLPAKARTITITNTGAEVAVNVQYSVSPALPAGTSISPANCGNIAPAASCVVTITPGSTPTAAPNQVPTPSVITFQGTNTPSVTTNAIVLTYGNIYQGGFVFAIDDSTAATTSVQGKVVTQTDQSTGISWSTNDTNIVPGINYDSTTATPVPALPASPPAPPYQACDGSFDGLCNSNNIRLYFAAQAMPINLYAAGYCDGTISGFNDWYLPAMCELGYGRALCGNAGTPTAQNVGSNILGRYYGTALVNFANLAFSPPDSYWSSTTIEGIVVPGEYTPYYIYFYELAPPPGGSAAVDQGNDDGQTVLKYVRCIRRF